MTSFSRRTGFLRKTRVLEDQKQHMTSKEKEIMSQATALNQQDRDRFLSAMLDREACLMLNSGREKGLFYNTSYRRLTTSLI